MAANEKLQQEERGRRQAEEGLKQRADELTATNERLQEQAIELTTANERLQQEASERSQAEEHLRQRLGELTSANEQHRRQSTEREQAEEDLKQWADELTATNERLQEQVLGWQQAGAELREYCDRLERRAEEQAIELTAANDKFEQAISEYTLAEEGLGRQVSELAAANQQLQQEIADYRQAEEHVGRSVGREGIHGPADTLADKPPVAPVADVGDLRRRTVRTLADSFWRDEPRMPEAALSLYKTLVPRLEGMEKLEVLVRQAWTEWELGQGPDTEELIKACHQVLNLLQAGEAPRAGRTVAELLIGLGKAEEARRFIERAREGDSSGKWECVDSILLSAAALSQGDGPEVRKSLGRFLAVCEEQPQEAQGGWTWRELRRWLATVEAQEKLALGLALGVLDGDVSLDELHTVLAAPG
jgi:hypothetical protein